MVYTTDWDSNDYSNLPRSILFETATEASSHQPDMSSVNSDIRTRLLIISDTHGKRPFDPATHPEKARKYGFHRPFPKADVAIHCGDLTISSDVEEYQTTFDMMREIDAPLKLVIPGNHDCSMDVNFSEKVVS